MAKRRTLIQFLSFWWRRTATGLCFALFMLSGLFLAFLVLPLIRLSPLPARKKSDWSLGLVNLAFYLFTCLMRATGGMIYRVSGLEHVDKNKSYLFIANHPTLIDVVAIMGLLPRCNCVVKKTLFRNRFMGGVLRQAGLIANDSGPILMELIQQEIKAGRSLLIFPEGTRSPPGGLHAFNRGAAQIAARTGLDVSPILITCNPPTLTKGQKWYDVPEHAFSFSIEFHPAFELPPEIRDETVMPLKVRRLNRMFEAFYKQKPGL